MPSREFIVEFRKLSAEDKAQLANGISDGTFSYN
jgi:hypothetical protein